MSLPSRIILAQCFLVLAPCGRVSVADGSVPNVIVIMADDLGAKELGCYGNGEHRTPNLDALARTGTMFRTCWATPICTSTRVQMMTGRYGFRTGWHNLILRPGTPPIGSPQFDVGESEITFADVLTANGYATMMVGKWQLPGQYPTLIHDCGFVEYCMWAYLGDLPAGAKYDGPSFLVEGSGPFLGGTSRFWHPCIVQNGQLIPTTKDDYGPNIFAEYLIDFVTRHPDTPFLAYYPMVLTHRPWEPTPDPDAPGGMGDRGLKANVEYMDKLVGRIIAAIDRLGLRRKTIVFFTADNGTAGQGKGTTTELGVRVPMIVNCPGVVQKGVVSEALVDLSDMLPTLAEFAGADLPADRKIDGRSFAPVLRGEMTDTREWIFSYLIDERLLRDKRWLLEGTGRFFDCGDSRDGHEYREVTESDDAVVSAARERFERILLDLPHPNLRGR